MLWNKTLLAAAVAGLALPVHAADPEVPVPTVPPAKEPGTDDATVLDKVVIQGAVSDQGFKAENQTGATPMPLSVRETPQSVSVITRESLDARQAMTLGQALELSAGVTQYSGNGPFAGQPSFGFNQTTIRGIDIDSIYDFREDGFVNGSYFSIPDLAIYDRIEVVKGANSVMYGRGSVGGLINRVRKKPLEQARTDIELSVGSFDNYRADLDTTGPLLGSDRVRGRLVAAYADQGAFVRGPETQLTLLAPSLAVDLTPHTRLLAQALYQQQDIIPNTGMPLRTVTDADGTVHYKAFDISRRRYLGVVTEDPYKWTIQSASVALEQDLGDQWLATLRLNSSKIKTPIKVDGYMNLYYDYYTGEGQASIVGNDFKIDRDVWGGELQVAGKLKLFGRPAEIAFGADHNDNQYSRVGAYTDYLPVSIYDSSFPRPDRSMMNIGYQTQSANKANGAYFQAHLRPTDRLGVLLGARYDKVKQHSESSFRGGGGNLSGSSDDDVTGRVALTYEVIEQISVYSLYAQSFQPVIGSLDINGKPLKPETGEIYELGAKTEWFDGRLGLSTAIYRVERENIPVGVPADPIAGTPPYSVSTGLQRYEGWELEINGRPLPGWDLSLAYNRLKDPEDPFLDGYQPGGVPDWQLGLYSAYELQTGPLKGLGAGVTYFAIDDRGVGYNPGTIPGYDRVDLHAFYKGLRNIEINLLIRNVGDQRYVEGADRPGGYAQFGSPTAAMLTLRYTVGGDER